MANEHKHTTADHSRLTSEDVALLVTRAADGEQAAWNALIDEFGGLVWATTRAHRLSSADAADVFQNTWMRLVENLDRVQDAARLGGWLATTARRESLTVIRHARRMIPRSDDLPDLVGDAPHPAQRLIREHDAAAVQTALARLGPRDRALLRMLAAEPTPSYAEISAALGIAIGSIGPTRARALSRLRREAAQVGLTPPQRLASDVIRETAADSAAALRVRGQRRTVDEPPAKRSPRRRPKLRGLRQDAQAATASDDACGAQDDKQRP